MTTTVPVKCPSCQASYNAPAERAGARFKCKRCGTSLTVPQPEPEALRPAVMPVVEPKAPERPVVIPVAEPKAPERPVVMPAKPSADAPRPVVMPAKPAAEAARPVVMPAQPAPPAARPVVMPAAAAATGDAPQKPVVAPSRPRSERPGRARPPVEAEPQETKSRAGLVLVILGIVAVLGVISYFMFGKGTPDEGQKPKATPETRPIASAPPTTDQRPGTFDAAKRLKEIKAETGAESAGQLWAFAQKLDAEQKSWREKGAPGDAADKLLEARDAALEDIIKVTPEHAEARAMRGEVKYDNELDPFFDANYLSDSDRELVRRNRLLVSTSASGNAGWITKTQQQTLVKPLVDRLGPLATEAESRNASPFGKAAKEQEAVVIADTIKLLGGKTSFRAFVYHPYLIIVEEDPAWSPATEAKLLSSPLKAIHEAFLKEFGFLGLTPLDTPVPVLFFKSETQYGEYNKAIGNTGIAALAHYEPSTKRLALNRAVSHETIIHEGTHQLFDMYTKNLIPHPRQSFWFQEGVAEWFGGSNRIQAKDKSWTYETGVLLDGRLGEWRTLEEHQFSLADLLDQTYAKRNEYIGKGPEGQKKIGLVYAQGWFLIYFLNHFNVDDNGFVQIGAKGKYQDGWNEYLKAELTGKTGKKVFMECLKLDDAGLEKMDKEFKQYFNFIVKKQQIGHVKDKKLVKWDEYVNKQGKKTGEKNDDMLVEPPRHQDK